MTDQTELAAAVKEHEPFTGVTFLFPHEVDEILPLLKEFNEEANYMSSDEIELSMIKDMVAAQFAAIFIYVHDDQLVGVLGAIAAPDLLAPKTRIKAQEIFWFVKKNFRGRGSFELLNAFEEWARAKGASEVSLATLGLDPRTEKLYARKGYQKTEVHYRKKWQESLPLSS